MTFPAGSSEKRDIARIAIQVSLGKAKVDLEVLEIFGCSSPRAKILSGFSMSQ